MLSRIRALPCAFLYWSGIAGQKIRGASILTIHGTPRRQYAELARQLGYLKRCRRVVPLPELVARLEARVDVDGMVALTFDDGLRSNVEVAYPLLKRLGLPATFFICPRLIDTRAWLWTHEARLRLRWLEAEDDAGLARRLARNLGAPAGIEAFVEWMKRLTLPNRLAVEGTLRAATPHFAADWEDHEECDLAAWEELRRLDPAVITFGSHTLTHPMLRSLRPSQLEAEIAGSRRLIEERLGRAVELFAYPDGEHHAAARAQVRAHYRAAVICAGRRVEPGIDPHLLPRVDLPRGALRLAAALHKHRARPAPLLPIRLSGAA